MQLEVYQPESFLGLTDVYVVLQSFYAVKCRKKFICGSEVQFDCEFRFTAI